MMNYEEDDTRINIIGRNGNNALHYDAEEQKPNYYKEREVNGMDVIDLIKHWDLNFNEGNILKYLLRDKENRIKDLTKIVDYTNREINYLNK